MPPEATEWTIDTSQLVAHIFYAVGNTDSVIVTCAHGDFTGTLLYPEADEVVIALRGAIPPLPPGAPVCVSYDGPSDSYRFYTEVTELAGNRLRAALPYALEHSDRRLQERIPLAPHSGLAFRVSRPLGSDTFPLLDISTGGVSFLERHDAGLRTGDVVHGEIVLPGEPSVPVDLEIRQLQLRRGQLQVGARIRAISVRNRARLAWFLLQMRTRVAA